MPESRAESPIGVEEASWGMVAPLPARAPSSTAIPLRFRRPPTSPIVTRETPTDVPATPESPLTPSTMRRRASRPPSTEFKTSHEFRPLYLLESTRKIPEPEENLPSLPSSRTTSRSSSVQGGSDDYFESARESPEPHASDRRGLGITADQYGLTDDLPADLLGSGQTTPRAGTVSPRIPMHATIPQSIAHDAGKPDLAAGAMMAGGLAAAAFAAMEAKAHSENSANIAQQASQASELKFERLYDKPSTSDVDSDRQHQQASADHVEKDRFDNSQAIPNTQTEHVKDGRKVSSILADPNDEMASVVAGIINARHAPNLPPLRKSSSEEQISSVPYVQQVEPGDSFSGVKNIDQSEKRNYKIEQDVMASSGDESFGDERNRSNQAQDVNFSRDAARAIQEPERLAQESEPNAQSAIKGNNPEFVQTMAGTSAPVLDPLDPFQYLVEQENSPKSQNENVNTETAENSELTTGPLAVDGTTVATMRPKHSAKNTDKDSRTPDRRKSADSGWLASVFGSKKSKSSAKKDKKKSRKAAIVPADEPSSNQQAEASEHSPESSNALEEHDYPDDVQITPATRELISRSDNIQSDTDLAVDPVEKEDDDSHKVSNDAQHTETMAQNYFAVSQLSVDETEVSDKKSAASSGRDNNTKDQAPTGLLGGITLEPSSSFLNLEADDKNGLASGKDEELVGTVEKHDASTSAIEASARDNVDPLERKSLLDQADPLAETNAYDPKVAENNEPQMNSTLASSNKKRNKKDRKRAQKEAAQASFVSESGPVNDSAVETVSVSKDIEEDITGTFTESATIGSAPTDFGAPELSKAINESEDEWSLPTSAKKKKGKKPKRQSLADKRIIPSHTSAEEAPLAESKKGKKTKEPSEATQSDSNSPRKDTTFADAHGQDLSDKDKDADERLAGTWDVKAEMGEFSTTADKDNVLKADAVNDNSNDAKDEADQPSGVFMVRAEEVERVAADSEHTGLTPDSQKHKQASTESNMIKATVVTGLLASGLSGTSASPQMDTPEARSYSLDADPTVSEFASQKGKKKDKAKKKKRQTLDWADEADDSNSGERKVDTAQEPIDESYHAAQNTSETDQKVDPPLSQPQESLDLVEKQQERSTKEEGLATSEEPESIADIAPVTSKKSKKDKKKKKKQALLWDEGQDEMELSKSQDTGAGERLSDVVKDVVENATGKEELKNEVGKENAGEDSSTPIQEGKVADSLGFDDIVLATMGQAGFDAKSTLSKTSQERLKEDQGVMDFGPASDARAANTEDRERVPSPSSVWGKSTSPKNRTRRSRNSSPDPDNSSAYIDPARATPLKVNADAAAAPHNTTPNDKIGQYIEPSWSFDVLDEKQESNQDIDEGHVSQVELPAVETKPLASTTVENTRKGGQLGTKAPDTPKGPPAESQTESPAESITTTKNRSSGLFKSPPSNRSSTEVTGTRELHDGATLEHHEGEGSTSRDLESIAESEREQSPTRNYAGAFSDAIPLQQSAEMPKQLNHLQNARGLAAEQAESNVDSPLDNEALAQHTPNRAHGMEYEGNSAFGRGSPTLERASLRSSSQASRTSSRLPSASDIANTRRPYARATDSEARSSSAEVNHDASVLSHRSITPSAVGSRSGTPTLRRVDRSMSSDLRSASGRGALAVSGSSKTEEQEVPATSKPTSPNYHPLKGAGKDRRQDMSEPGSNLVSHVAHQNKTIRANLCVQEGWSAPALSSPRSSPSRPPSIRKRQSSHILDLERRLDQLSAENRSLQESRARGVSDDGFFTSTNSQHEAVRARDLQIQEKDIEIHSIKASLETLQAEVARLTRHNAELQSTSTSSGVDERYALLEAKHRTVDEQWQKSSRELEALQQKHSSLSRGMEDVVREEISTALEEKDQEIQGLRAELDHATDKIQELQSQIAQTSRGEEYLNVRDEDYFDSACQQLCQHVQQWVLRYSKFSDTRVCRLSHQVKDEKIETRLDNAILDGSDVDDYLSDRVRRRDVFMSVVMTMIWEFVFTRYLFGMDRDQRQKLKALEKTLTEVGPARAVAQWRATTLTLLSRRSVFVEQRAQDTEAVVQEIYGTLSRLLPAPSHLVEQIQESLRNVMRLAVSLSIEMRTQRAEYIMLPPLQPEYDTNGELARRVFFNASLMNERSGETSSNEDLENQQAAVRLVLFPLVVKKGNDLGESDEEVVVCPAQVLVARPSRDKKAGRVLSGPMNTSTYSVVPPGGLLDSDQAI